MPSWHELRNRIHYNCVYNIIIRTSLPFWRSRTFTFNSFGPPPPPQAVMIEIHFSPTYRRRKMIQFNDCQKITIIYSEIYTWKLRKSYSLNTQFTFKEMQMGPHNALLCLFLQPIFLNCQKDSMQVFFK